MLYQVALTSDREQLSEHTVKTICSSKVGQLLLGYVANFFQLLVQVLQRGILSLLLLFLFTTITVIFIIIIIFIVISSLLKNNLNHYSKIVA